MKSQNYRQKFRGDYFGCDFSPTGGTPFRPFYEPLLYLTNVYVLENGNWQYFADYRVLNYGKQFSRLGELEYGDRIEFNAQVNCNGGLRYPSKVHLCKDNSIRKSIPLGGKELIGYVMDHTTNKEGTPYYLDSFNKWQKEKHSAADQSNAKCPTTSNHDSCYPNYDSLKEGNKPFNK